jgi:hypothetical protein
MWKWEVVTIDFITKLPKTMKQHDSIMVVVDKLTKETHFIPMKTTHKETNIVEIYMKEFTIGYMGCLRKLFQIEIQNSHLIFAKVCSKDLGQN